MSAEFERITCEQVELFDKVARAKTHEFHAVVQIDEGPVARRLWFASKDPFSSKPSWNIRPRRDTKLWRIRHE